MANEKYFAITVGPKPGIYFDVYDNIKSMVNGVKNSKNPYKGFKTYLEAEKWMKGLGFPELCVFRSLTEETREEYCSTDIAENDELPWDVVTDSKCNSPQLQQETQEKKDFISNDSVLQFSKIDYWSLENALDSKQKRERNRINEPDQSPITQRVRSYARSNGFGHLSDEQLRAVQKETGKALLFAVPGSGKTTVIVARTGYLIYECNVSPEKIMTLTFTKAAAEEMRSRYLKTFARRMEKAIPQFRTIHSFCYSVILKRLKLGGFKIPTHTIEDSITVTEDDNPDNTQKITMQKILSDILKNNGVNATDASDERVQERLLTYISSCKNRKLTEEQRNCDVYLSKEVTVHFKPLYDAYVEELRRYDCMDYDDMLMLSYEGLKLKKYEYILEKLREDYTYWSIDEAQDNSLLQCDLMNLLAGEDGNLFMVGDDDQSIYGFRGAEPKALLSFGRDPAVVTMIMGTNYRSDSLIVESTRSFIESFSEDRAPKPMMSNSQEEGKVSIWPAVPSLMDQYAFILNAARGNIQINRGLPQADWKSLAVLYRNNISGLPVMFLLKKHGIPFTASKSAGELLRGKPINLILNIIRFALRPTSKDLYEKARHSIKVYVRNDQKAEFDVLRKKNPKMAILDIIRLMNPDQAHLKKIDDAQSVLKAIPTKTSAEAVKFIINSSLEIGQTGGLGDRERIYALLTICFLYPDLHELINAISEICSKFRKEPSVIEEEKEELTEQDDAEQFATPKAVPAKVILSTAHKAKGREFDHVIIIDALEPPAITSSTSDLERTDPEEERRLFYVAMTRAKHKLDILSVETYYGTNEIPSHFISDYANICETLTDQTIIQCEWPTLPSLTDESIAIPELKERVLYAVRKGNEIGIFYTDAERRKAVNGYSNPEQKKCYSMQEALQYLYPEGIPKDMRPLNTKTLSGILYLTSSSIINKKTDLPGWLNVALPRLASVNRLSQLSPHDIAVLHDSVSTLFKDDSETDYSGKGIPYALAYLPANVLKVWKPLWVMVQKQMLPHQLTILETGPGPGTATIGLITFYSMIAQDNPDITFSIKYHTVERQKDFVPVFSAMTHACLQSIPTNLHVEIIPLELKDAYIYMASISRPTYDIILESNMMNASEGLDSEKMIAWLHGIEAGLKPNGFLIQIEPGKTVDRYNLQRLAAALHQITQSYDQGLNAIDVSGFTFQREAEEAKLRYAHKTEHWFNWMLLRRT